jgi:hypothetical protein
MHGRHFTWSNERDTPTLTKIDRILVSVDWELASTDSFLQALASGVSDHAPVHTLHQRSVLPQASILFQGVLELDDVVNPSLGSNNNW